MAWERLHVHLIEKASIALAAINQREGLSKTDAVNRAIQLYDLVRREEADGAVLTLLRPDGSLDRIKIL